MGVKARIARGISLGPQVILCRRGAMVKGQGSSTSGPLVRRPSRSRCASAAAASG